ncbi:hypothetical protein F4680DRAFT_444579 [Xylaria scruposa]|nr:hypothetical protein F4680DRAFT_444579 [Xylaria scruposa]
MDASGNTITTQVMLEHGINAHSVRVAFHSSDILGQFSFTNTIEAPTPKFTTSLSTPTSEVGSSTAHSMETWPTGAWIGVGAGSTVGVILLLSSIVWLIRRQYYKKQQFRSLPDTPIPPEPDKPYVPEIHSITRLTELNGAPGLYELGTKTVDEALVSEQRVT